MANIVRIDPFNDMLSLREAMDRLFAESFVRPATATRTYNGENQLAVDLYETKDELVLKARVPGVNPEEVEVSINGDILTIKAELASDAMLDEAKGWRWHRHELAHGEFSRSITLPTLIQTEKIEATFHEGELKLVLPKAEELKPKTIKVTATR